MYKKTFANRTTRKIFFTKGARFTCQKRLERKIDLSNFSIAALSAVVISASLITIAFASDLDRYQTIILSCLTIINSIAILVLSLTENAANRAMMAAEIYRCGLELNRLYDSINALLATGICKDEVSVLELSWNKEYHAILARCPFNHQTIDVRRFQAENIDELFDMSCLKSFLYWLKGSALYFLNMYFTVIAVLLILAASGLVIFYLVF